MQRHEHGTKDLTRNQSLVHNALKTSKGPLSAYEILDQLRDEGIRAPLQVYRALDVLVKYGMVHRLESLNAFIACSHPKCEAHDVSVFGICDDCSTVFEIADTGLEVALKHLAQVHSFNANKAMVELRGQCQACQQASVQ